MESNASDAAQEEEMMTPFNPLSKTWQRWLRGTRFFDTLWGQGKRCPVNGIGGKCYCARPMEEICRTYHALVALAPEIGEETVRIVGGL